MSASVRRAVKTVNYPSFVFLNRIYHSRLDFVLLGFGFFGGTTKEIVSLTLYRTSHRLAVP